MSKMDSEIGCLDFGLVFVGWNSVLSHWFAACWLWSQAFEVSNAHLWLDSKSSWDPQLGRPFFPHMPIPKSLFDRTQQLLRFSIDFTSQVVSRGLHLI